MSHTTGYFQSYNSSERPTKVQGMDVSHFQLGTGISFASAYAAGTRFVTFKAGGVYATRFQARYIRCTVNGSYTNSSSIFNEIQVWASTTPTGTVLERAAGKTVTGSKAVPDVGAYSNFVDGNTSTYVLVGDFTQWVQVDLAATYYVYHIVLFHYANRTFKQNKVEYSLDGTTWTTFFDSDTSGEYMEYGGVDLFNFGGVSQDSQFTAANVASARAAGLKVGAYFFKNPNYYSTTAGRFMNATADASSHASSFVGYIKSAIGTTDFGDCLAWLDWENDQGSIYPATNNSGSYDYITTFCNTYKALTNGRQCGMYTAWYTIETCTTVTATHLCYSSSTAVGSVLPLWLSLIIDTTSAYPTNNYNAWGYFENDLWTMWQYSYNNTSAAYHGMLGTALDLDLLEGGLETIMPPTPVSTLAAVPSSTSIRLTWATGESDVRGYMFKISGQSTATVGTGIGSCTLLGLNPNTSYIISAYAYDMWEHSISATVITQSTSSVEAGGSPTLLCFKIPS